MSALELRDLCDEHVAISGAAARLAAKRSSSEHHAKLQHYIDALGEATTRTERRRADARFHIEIAVAAQSVRLTHAEMSLQAEIGELMWIPGKAPSHPKPSSQNIEPLQMRSWRMTPILLAHWQKPMSRAASKGL
jgi:DNA-binding FadR family transcriptional regulator